MIGGDVHCRYVHKRYWRFESEQHARLCAHEHKLLHPEAAAPAPAAAAAAAEAPRRALKKKKKKQHH